MLHIRAEIESMSVILFNPLLEWMSNEGNSKILSGNRIFTYPQKNERPPKMLTIKLVCNCPTVIHRTFFLHLVFTLFTWHMESPIMYTL